MKMIKLFNIILEELKSVKWILSWRGVYEVLKIFINKILTAIWFTFYFIIIFFICLFKWLWKWIIIISLKIWNNLLNFISSFPKAIVVIFIMSFIGTISFFKVQNRINQVKYQKVCDSLFFEMERIKQFSTYDSGFAEGLRQGNNLRFKINEDSIIKSK